MMNLIQLIITIIARLMKKATRCWLEASKNRSRVGKQTRRLLISESRRRFFEFIDLLSSANELYVVQAKHNHHTGETSRQEQKNYLSKLRKL